MESTKKNSPYGTGIGTHSSQTIQSLTNGSLPKKIKTIFLGEIIP